MVLQAAFGRLFFACGTVHSGQRLRWQRRQPSVLRLLTHTIMC
jgi:hypothetical protein